MYDVEERLLFEKASYTSSTENLLMLVRDETILSQEEECGEKIQTCLGFQHANQKADVKGPIYN